MGANITQNTRQKVFKKYKGKCAYCGIKLDKNNFTVDHIEPKRRGEPVYMRGTDKIHNLNPCCGSCNSSKACFSIEKWRHEISLKYDRLLRDSSTFRILDRFKLISRRKEVIFHFEKHDPTY
jgi:uncharacterized protein (TIGR02646 family)